MGLSVSDNRILDWRNRTLPRFDISTHEHSLSMDVTGTKPAINCNVPFDFDEVQYAWWPERAAAEAHYDGGFIQFGSLAAGVSATATILAVRHCFPRKIVGPLDIGFAVSISGAGCNMHLGLYQGRDEYPDTLLFKQENIDISAAGVYFVATGLPSLQGDVWIAWAVNAAANAGTTFSKTAISNNPGPFCQVSANTLLQCSVYTYGVYAYVAGLPAIWSRLATVRSTTTVPIRFVIRRT